MWKNTKNCQHKGLKTRKKNTGKLLTLVTELLLLTIRVLISGRSKIFFVFSKMARPAMGPTQSFIQRVQESSQRPKLTSYLLYSKILSVRRINNITKFSERMLECYWHDQQDPG